MQPHFKVYTTRTVLSTKRYNVDAIFDGFDNVISRNEPTSDNAY